MAKINFTGTISNIMIWTGPVKILGIVDYLVSIGLSEAVAERHRQNLGYAPVMPHDWLDGRCRACGLTASEVTKAPTAVPCLAFEVRGE